MLQESKFDETGVDFYFIGLLVGEDKNGTFSVFDAYPISHSRVTAASLQIAFEIVEICGIILINFRSEILPKSRDFRLSDTTTIL